MTNTTVNELLTPVGRLVQGSIHRMNDKDATGKPLTVKNGPNAGQPRQECFFAVAIPKTAGVSDWKNEAWAAPIVQAAKEGFPRGQYNNPNFAWKIVDGDSQTPDQRGNKPCEKQGFSGHWVLRFSSGYLPKVLDTGGRQPLDPGREINLGDYVEVLCPVRPNGDQMKPGVYLNATAVAFAGYGERIVNERDFSNAGFGQSPLPAGASATPVAAGIPTQAAPAPAAPAPVAAPAAPAPLPVPPNPAVLQAQPAPAKQMTPSATATYEQYVAAGWTDEQLVQNGLMVA